MQLHRGLRRDAWIFSLDYGRRMGDPKSAVSGTRQKRSGLRKLGWTGKRLGGVHYKHYQREQVSRSAA
jgi:hypothetical protein